MHTNESTSLSPDREREPACEKDTRNATRVASPYEFLKESDEIKEMSADAFLSLVECADERELEVLARTIEESQAAKFKPFQLFGCDPPAKEPQSPISVILWWEFRRPAYNLIIGLCGTLTLIALSTLNHAPIAFLAMGALSYGCTANICYTFGWILELLARSVYEQKAKNIGPVLFKLGTVFSVLVTLAITIMLPQILFLTASWPQ